MKEIQDENLNQTEIPEEEHVEESPEEESIEASDYDESSDEEGKEEDSEAESEAKGPHWARDRILLDKIRRDNYRYAAKLQENEAILQKQQEEIDQLRYLNDMSMKASLSHYEAAAKERLDRAKDMREAALESGDTKAIAETDIAMSKAVYEMEKLRGYKDAEMSQAELDRAAQERAYIQQQYQQPVSPVPNLTEETTMLANEWAGQNDWFQQNSPNYDPNRAAAANQICDYLDNWCRANGMPHMIGTEQYFQSLDHYLNQYAPQAQGNTMSKQNQKPMTQNYQQRQSVVAPARGRAPGAAAMQTRGAASNIKLANIEREWARKLNLSEDEYRDHKAKSMKNDYFQDQVKQSRGR